MRQSQDRDLLEALKAILPEIGPERGLPAELGPELESRLLAAMPGLKERAKTLVELLDSAYYLYAARPLALEAKAAALLDAAARERMPKLAEKLAALPEWAAPALEAAVREFAEASSVKLGQVAQPLRAALTGRTTSPGLFDVMAVLGREEVLARLGDVA